MNSTSLRRNSASASAPTPYEPGRMTLQDGHFKTHRDTEKEAGMNAAPLDTEGSRQDGRQQKASDDESDNNGNRTILNSNSLNSISTKTIRASTSASATSASTPYESQA